MSGPARCPLPTPDDPFRLPTRLALPFHLPTIPFHLSRITFRFPTITFRLPTIPFRLPTITFHLPTIPFRLPTRPALPSLYFRYSAVTDVVMPPRAVKSPVTDM